jgi:hypothetical protein
MTNKAQDNPYVFVVGCPRSGTTLLQRMMDNHPDLTVANDTHFIMRAAKKELRKSSDPLMSKALVNKVLNYHRFKRMGLSTEEVVQTASGADRYSEFVRNLYNLRGVAQGKPLSGEKTPDFCRKMPALHALAPGARFIHIIRDGRNTALSTMNWAGQNKGPGRWTHWNEDGLSCCALWWRWQSGIGIRDGWQLPEGQYHEIKYEDLVSDSTTALSSMANFLQIPDSDRMARYFEGKTKANPKLSPKSAWLPPTKGLRNWCEEMTQPDVAVFEAIAGKLLVELGYELSGTPPSDETMNRVSKAEQWWRTQKMSKH